MNTPARLDLAIYYATADAGFMRFVDDLRGTLDHHYPDGGWSLELVDVLDTPEKALANDVFTTPTLVRHGPPPVLKLLGKITQISKVLSAVACAHHETSTVVI